MPINSGSQSSAGRQPGTPIIGTATAGNASGSIAFTSPDYTGKPNTSLTYTATTTPDSVTGTSSSSPISISGLRTTHLHQQRILTRLLPTRV